jgi:hypothetical protein
MLHLTLLKEVGAKEFHLGFNNRMIVAKYAQFFVENQVQLFLKYS